MADPDEQYFARIERHFGRRRGGPLLLSPRDWHLLESWRADGIPLRVVLRGINQAFDRFEASGPRPDRINSLRYCEQEVHAAWEEHRAAHPRTDEASGSSDALPGAAQHLGAVAAACREAAADLDGAARDCLADAADALDELQHAARDGALEAPDIDRRCTELEEELRARLAALTGRSPELEQISLPSFSPY